MKQILSLTCEPQAPVRTRNAAFNFAGIVVQEGASPGFGLHSLLIVDYTRSQKPAGVFPELERPLLGGGVASPI